MTFLFGMFFPSYQAHAKGNNTFAASEKVQLNIKFNDDLADKLASSKTFEKIFNNYFVLAFLFNNNIHSISAEEFKQLEERLSSAKILKIEDNNSINNMLGFNNNTELIEFSTRFTKLNEKLNFEFPELSLLSPDSKENVIKNAISKGNLVEKAFAVSERNDCFNKVTANWNTCMYGGMGWKAKLMLSATIICGAAALITAFTAGIVITLSTEGIGFPEGILTGGQLFVYLTARCAQFSAAALTVVEVGETVLCQTKQFAETELCVKQYGLPAGGAD